MLTVSTCLARPIVVLMTDFGLESEAVGLCHGAALSVDSDIQVVDLTHNLNAYDIKQAALVLRGTTVFPKDTVFVAVVDPGVGTARRPIILKTRSGLYYVGPNNGLFTYVVADQGIESVAEIEPGKVNPKWKPGTFDGRDLFTPTGAMLAVSRDMNRVGKAVTTESLVLFEIQKAQVDAGRAVITGSYTRTDEPYGNVWTNISVEDLEAAGIQLGDILRLKTGKRVTEVPYVVSFGHVPTGKPLAYISSSGVLAFAVNMGDFRKVYSMKEGAGITVQKIVPKVGSTPRTNTSTSTSTKTKE